VSAAYRSAAAHQPVPSGPASTVKREATRSKVDSRRPSCSTHRCGTRDPGAPSRFNRTSSVEGGTGSGPTTAGESYRYPSSTLGVLTAPTALRASPAIGFQCSAGFRSRSMACCRVKAATGRRSVS